LIALRENHDKTKFYVPKKLVCKFTPDPEMVLRCQDLGMKPYKGFPVGKVMFDQLREVAMSEATQFAGHMQTQGNILRGDITEMELWGPYRNKPTGNRLVNIEEGNPLVPEGKWALSSKGAWSPEVKGPRVLDKEEVLYDRDWRHGVCFLIRGDFLATRGHQEETTGVVIL
jgi:hypothetical protein